jgi:WhiB family transcriptional regulator, redox-sensing transcriptional regulator
MTADPHRAEWWSRAACQSADPELFFPISEAGQSVTQIAGAKAVCAGCGVRRECLTFALVTGQPYGVWGGTSPEERQALRKKARAPGLGTAAMVS